ncbi:MAG: PEP-CTERM sorting domain-containing protein [Kiritimatiellae bacterium]|nr:PEP-CTERM sorting domain-containing protein [Kiritimatiellia bacterium]
MKKLMLLASVVLLGFAASADAMYWQLSSMNSNVDPSSWTMAQVHVTGGDPAVDTYLKVWDGTGFTQNVVVKGEGVDGAWFDLTGYHDPSYSFVLELINDSYEVQGYGTAAANYTQLQSAGAVSTFDTLAPVSYTAWNAGFVAIPEPTSGLLLMLGASLLALRRRRV